MQIRRFEVADLAAGRALGAEAFGPAPPGVPQPSLAELPPGRFDWGCWEAGPDGDRLAAKAAGLTHTSWYGGRPVPTCGVASVTVAAEDRGRGLLRGLLHAVLVEARDRGEVIATMFPTALGAYRSTGFELIGSLDTVTVPTAELTGVAAPHGVHTRRATAADLPAVESVYATWAAAQNGPVARTSASFAGLLDRDGAALSLAVDELGSVVGYLSWERGPGYGSSATLAVDELLATSADGYRALWRLAASFAAVTGTVRMRTSGADPARLVLPTATWDVVEQWPYCLRVLDLPGAVAAMAPALPADARAEVDLVVVGDALHLVEGAFRLRLGPDGSSCEPIDVDLVGASVLDVRGLSLLMAGAQSCGNLRLLGLLKAGSAYGDRVLDAAFGGRPVHVRDYF